MLQVNRNDDIGAQRTRQRNRHRVNHRAINQPITIMCNRGHQTRNTARGPHGKVQITFGKPQFATRT